MDPLIYEKILKSHRIWQKLTIEQLQIAIYLVDLVLPWIHIRLAIQEHHVIQINHANQVNQDSQHLRHHQRYQDDFLPGNR